MVIWYISQIETPQHRPQNIIVLIMGPPKKVPLMFGRLHILTLLGWLSLPYGFDSEGALSLIFLSIYVSCGVYLGGYIGMLGG